jgi:hypothetical protein
MPQIQKIKFTEHKLETLKLQFDARWITYHYVGNMGPGPRT